MFVGTDGVLTLGPELTSRLTSTPAQVWSLASGADGTIWAGTGGDGRLLRLRPGQPEETAAATTESAVFAVAVSGSKTYFATSPGGHVYVIDGASAARPFFSPAEKYIWTLAVDRTGQLWVGTGTPAVIYRVDATGSGRVIYRPPSAHVVCLTMDSTGRMLAGTESPGRVYRFDAADRPSVVLDTELTEARAVVAGPGGELYVAALGRGDETASSSGETASVAIATPPAPPSGTPPPTATPANRRSAVFRIDPSGTWETYWDTPDVIYDLALDADGGLYAASGPDGRLYKIVGNNQAQLLTGVDAHQVTKLLTASGHLVAMATANPGHVIAVGSALQSPASYVSPVHDTKSASTWGTIRWESRGAVTLQTRSGNTEKPDETWTDWSNPYTHATGEPVTSPAARFIQWKAVLTNAAGGAPTLTSVTLAYLPRNGRPTVSSITVDPPGIVFQKPFSDETAIAGIDDATADARRLPSDGATPPPLGHRMYQKGLQTIEWKAEDPDSDRLIYTISYRLVGESTWHPLKTNWVESIVVWDTTTVADGQYIVRVSASDAPSNTPDRALVGQRESEPITVDNTPPVLTMTVSRQGGAIHLLVHAVDTTSPIEKLEYSIGGASWQLVYPVNGVADSPDERYDIAVGSEADLARIVVRATDSLQNVATQPAPVR